MADTKQKRLSKVAKELNVGISTIVEFLEKKDVTLESTSPNSKINHDSYQMLLEEFSSEMKAKEESVKLNLPRQRGKKSVSLDDVDDTVENDETDEDDGEVLIKDVSSGQNIVEPTEKTEEKEEPKAEEKEEPKAEEKKEPETKEKEGPKAEEKKEPEAEEKKEPETKEKKEPKIEEVEPKVLGKINLDSINQKTRPDKKTKKQIAEEKALKIEKEKEAARAEAEEKVRLIEEAKKTKEEKEIAKKEEQKPEEYKTKFIKLNGPTVVGKIDLKEIKEDDKSKEELKKKKKKKRKRIRKDKEKVDLAKKDSKVVRKDKTKRKKRAAKPEISDEEIQKQVKETLARLTSKEKSKATKFRKLKREAAGQKIQEEVEKKQEEKGILKVTEFVTANELAQMMEVQITEIISTCMNLGLFVSINQRLDAETMSLVAEEFGFEVEFVSVEVQEAIADKEEDDVDKLKSRPPIVTIMGHVDHGKTSLLDYIRNTNVIAGESGGITQHIGAYNVELDDNRQISFLDTPGHEAFTAMRARGAQVTDLAVIVVSADDAVMPQTVEAINHASAAGVPLVFAINKIDKPNANPEKIKEELANMNYMVEEWGGKYQSQDISAKAGTNVDELLEKILLEAELLDLKANPEKNANGVIIESTLDRGRGYVATILVQAGTLKMGDVVLAGQFFGHVKAMFNERNHKVDEAGPAHPVLILGLNGAPQAGDSFNVMNSEREARDIANKREQLQREQDMRVQKHITLDEIGRRLAIGDFKELNIIIKGDVDGSVEALSDSLQKLSTERVAVNIIHKAVGQISETDVMLASASDAIILGFQVRPSLLARKMAEKEQIDIRLYSIIYDATNEIKDALEGMLSPEIKEEISGTAEIREVFKITKVGTVAGCMVKDGRITRKHKVRIIRDGIVVYNGELGSLKRFKDDVKEVVSGYECGLNIENFNDIKVGDFVEAYHEVEVQQKL